MAPTADVLHPIVHGDHNSNEKYSYKFQEYLKNVEHFKDLALKPEEKIGHSGPQGKVVPLTIVDDPADWTAASLKGREGEYTYTLTKADVDEIIAAVEKIRSRIPATEDAVIGLKKDDYDLPNFGPKLIELVKNVSLGRGFQLLSGFPVQHFEGDRFGLVLAFWGLALILGTPQVSQTDYNRDHKTFGSLLNHISVGRHATVPASEVYPNSQTPKDRPGKQTRDVNRIEFHSDQGATDLIALLSITAAPKGGESKWVSALAIHNELLRRGRKDLVEVLTKPELWKVPFKNDQNSYKRLADGSHAGYEADPPFLYHDGYLSSHFASPNYQEIDLSPLQQEAAWAVAAIAEDPNFHLSKILQPGEIEIISNQIIYHARGDVFEGEEAHEKRHLLRWWVAQPKERNPRGIIPTFAPRSNVRPEGGFSFPGQEDSKLRLPFYPYSRRDLEGQSEW